MIFEPTNKEFLEEHDEEMDLLFRLNEYADSHPEFDSKYIDSINSFFKNKYPRISGNQYNILVKIYDKLVDEGKI